MPLFRSKTVDHLAELEQKRLELTSQTEIAEAELETAVAELAALADREASVFLGEADDSLEYDRERARAAVDGAERELARLVAIADPLEQRIARGERLRAQEQVDDARERLLTALRERYVASERFAGALPLKELAVLEAARDAVDAAVLAYEAAGGVSEVDGDEPGWPDKAEALASTIAAGPHREAADRDHAASAERQRCERERREELQFVVQQRLSGMKLEALAYRIPDEEFEAEVERRVEEVRAPIIAARAAAETGRRILRAG